MCTVLLPPGVNPNAVKYIVSYIVSYHVMSYHIISYHNISYVFRTFELVSIHKLERSHLHKERESVINISVVIQCWIKLMLYLCACI